MKILKSYNRVVNETLGDFSNLSLLTEEQINWCYTHLSSLWGVNDDGEVYCDGNIKIIKSPRRFLVQFADMDGEFNCSDNIHLTSLKGSPRRVKSFHASNCINLTSLEGGPVDVEFRYFCDYSKITNLIGAPSKVKELYLSHSYYLESLDGCPEDVDRLILYYNANLKTLKGVSIVNDHISVNMCTSLYSLDSLDINSQCNISAKQCALSEEELIYNWKNNLTSDDIERFKSDWEI
jgi:hypothetical protein